MFPKVADIAKRLTAVVEDWREERERLKDAFDALAPLYDGHRDPFGLNLKSSFESMKLAFPLYRNYFRVRVMGAQRLQHVPTQRPLMVVSNHSGQIPIDGMLLTVAFMADVKPPRLVRSMVERFVNTLPFFGAWMGQSGAVLGDRANCLYLLNRGESILVFPEGVKGISKSSSEYYQLQHFTPGFFRMALAVGVDILPVAVVGAEEFYPWVHQARGLAKALGMPALPLSPTYLLGPLGAIPMPSPVDVHIGEIYTVPKDIGQDAPDEVVEAHVSKIRSSIQGMLDEGRKHRRPFFAQSNLLKEKT